MAALNLGTDRLYTQQSGRQINPLPVLTSDGISSRTFCELGASQASVQQSHVAINSQSSSLKNGNTGYSYKKTRINVSIRDNLFHQSFERKTHCNVNIRNSNVQEKQKTFQMHMGKSLQPFFYCLLLDWELADIPTYYMFQI